MDFPELSNEEIEAKALELLESYYTSIGKSITAPIPVEIIAETYLGYDIEFVDDGIFSNPSVLGGIVFEDSVIYVNVATEAHEGRYNFTIAHELGHHALHKPLVDGTQIVCRESDNRPIEEAQADRFAAALLMPQAAIDLAVSTVGLAPKAHHPKVIRGYAAKVSKAASMNNVSNTAVINRLIDLGYLSDSEGYYSSFRKTSHYQANPLKALLSKAYKLLKS
jgi:Zn-dependent peptidase ImmA (M78 family)